MKTARTKSANSCALVLVATTLLSLTAANAQTPRVSSDGGPILNKGISRCSSLDDATQRIAQPSSGSISSLKEKPADPGNKPQLEPHPALPGAEVTVEAINPSTVRYCIRPIVSNISDEPTPAPLSLWLASGTGNSLTAYSALHVTNRAPAVCSTQIPQALAGQSSAKAPATWCVIAPANGPKPDLALYLGAPDKKVFSGNLSTGKVAAGTHAAGPATVVTAGYAEVCKIDFGSARQPNVGVSPRPLGTITTLCGGARTVSSNPRSTPLQAPAAVSGPKK